MKVSDFDYDLPEALIAQTPLNNRESSRLLVVDDFNLLDTKFEHIGDFLNEGDVLVFNDTRVLPARLFGIKTETGAHVEALILEIKNDKEVVCLVGNARVVKLGTVVSFGDHRLLFKCIKVEDEGIRHFEMRYEGIFLELLDTLGEMPLPPYIHEKLEDKERYQTVYAKTSGSAAAPTAGLHFTNQLLKDLEAKGVVLAPVTLHVGLATFRPVKVKEVTEHKMHSEWYHFSKKTAEICNLAKKENRKIIAVGTTSVRTLETVYKKYHKFKEDTGQSDIFIYPGYEFEAVDGIITNFHLPKSTLLMLVSAFTSLEIIKHAYQHAIDHKYRFFSFGDSMFLSHKKVI